jgi:hypothetical protein
MLAPALASCDLVGVRKVLIAISATTLAVGTLVWSLSAPPPARINALLHPMLDRSPGEAELVWPTPVGDRVQSPRSALASTTTRTLSVVDTFAGSSSSDTTGDPPDPSIAVGAGFVVQAVNAAVRIWTTQGELRAVYPLASFMASGDDVSDPRVVFDASSGRWFASAVDVARATIQLAVSSSPDPTAPWAVYTHSSGSCPDQPSLGIDANLVVVGYGAFSTPCRSNPPPAYLGGALLVFDKGRLLDGTAQAYDWGPRPDLSPVTAVSPALGTTAAVALVMPPFAGGPTYLTLLSLPQASLAAAVLTPKVSRLPIGALTPPPPALQAGTSGQVATNDVRILAATTSGRSLWLAGNDGCVPPRDRKLRSCLRVVEVTKASVRLDTDVGVAGDEDFYPALAPLGKAGLVAVVHGSSSATAYPGLAVFALMPDGRRTRTVKIASGTGPSLSNRFGDYFGAATDSSGRVWVTGEVGAPPAGDTASWATAIASITTGTSR